MFLGRHKPNPMTAQKNDARRRNWIQPSRIAETGQALETSCHLPSPTETEWGQIIPDIMKKRSPMPIASGSSFTSYLRCFESPYNRSPDRDLLLDSGISSRDLPNQHHKAGYEEPSTQIHPHLHHAHSSETATCPTGQLSVRSLTQSCYSLLFHSILPMMISS